MKPPVKFLSTVLGITSLLSLIFLIYPRSLSPQTSSLTLDTTASPSLDFDGNGIVDFPDFLMFISAFGSEEGQDKYDVKYDLNSDGKIAFEDFLILTDNFGKNVVAQKSPTSSDQDASTPQSMAENTGATGATLPVTALEESVVATTPQPLTEATLDGSVVTLTLNGAIYERSSFDVRDHVKVSGIAGISVGTFGIDRESDTVVTVELDFNGNNMTTNGTLTFTVEAGALANYNGPVLTTTLPVTALEESVVASTPQPLTEATLDGSVVTLTLNGATYESSIFDIRDHVKVSGIAGISVGTFGIRRRSDTVVTVELDFNGNMTTNGTLTFTVEAGAIAGYSGSALTATLPVTALEESVVASTPQPLTEATLDGSVVTLTLSGAAYERSSFDVRDHVKVSGIAGISVGTFGIDRESDTVVTVELDFNGNNMTTNGTLTFTVEAGALANYNGPVLTTTLPVTALEESVVASTPQPLTEATLDGSVVTLTLNGATYESSIFDIRDHVKVSGIAGISVGTFGIRRRSDTVVTVELDFNGNMTTNGTLTFTVEAGALANYNGPALTTTLPVIAGSGSGGSGGSGNNPDLIVESPAVSDSSPDAGAYFTLRATVRNQGGRRSASTTLRYYQSTDATITTGDTEVTTDSVRSLDPSGISDESARVRAPSSKGTYYYGACVEAVTGESDTGNNCSSAVTVTVSGSDLIVESPSVSDSSPGPGASFTLSAIVRNQGGDSAPSTTLRYYISTDVTISTDDTEVDTDYVSPLDPSETSDESARIEAPSSEGTYYYGACVEAVTGESDTGNNCSSAITVTVSGSDLIVESPTVSESSPGPGASFTLSAIVRNQGGSRSASTTLRYYLSTDVTINTNDQEVENDYVSRLAPSESSDESADLNAPSSDGTYYYGACVDAASGESDAGNNCSSAVTITVGSTTTPPTPNQPPVFSEGTSTTRSIAENTGAGQNIGNPVSATDGDSDRLTYSLEGRDARAFTILPNSGQLRTRSGVSYDYETKNSYSVTVRAQDGKGGSATISVTITLTDENEAPGRPDAPTVTASTLNSLSLRWTAPTNSGSAISDYDVQYRTQGGSFTDWPHTGTGTTTTITGLTANTRYEIQVRARNAQGESNWSPSATGTTTANQSPVFSEGTSTTRNIAENTGAGQNIGNPISATDGDNDQITYSLEGRDASAFTVQSNSGQLRTRSGRTYDYETKDRYSVTLRAQDGKGGSATISVEITLTDESEPPGRPAAPTVTASSNSLRVRWTAPENTGPAINDYDIQYRATGGNFTDWSHTGTSTTTTITGLMSDTRYEVQVRATNDEGTGNWSSSGNGTTSTGGSNNPDLIVETPTISDSSPIAPGSYFKMRTLVRNQGGGQAHATTLRYYLSTDETITTDDTEIGTDSLGSFKEDNQESVTLQAPSSEGTYYYGACVDAVSGESDTGNNCSSAVTVTVVGPDLIVESPSVDNNTPTPGRLIRLSATVRNQGGGRSSSTRLRYYQSTDATITTGDQEVDTDYVSSLDPSETSDEWDLFSAPSSAGTYYYGACVDAVTGESDTGNNCSSAVTVTIRSAPPPPAPNQPPVFSEGTSTTRSMAENTGAGQNIGNPVNATDSDGDRLTYSLQGRDASAFTIVSGSGQLRTRSSVRYDYETKDSYSVTVRVQDGEGGSATISVTITLTDENEPPDRPDAPVVTASTLNSLSLRWTAPTNPGPAISDYDVQYKESGGNFTDWPHTGTGTTTTITGLTANTNYEVQVRATNDEGTSDWSPSVTGTTISNQSPVFSEGASTTRSTAENTGAGQNIGNPVSATDGDSDQLTYSLEGRDASAFTVQSNSGQLRTQSGETYDYETKDTYSVAVRARDGKGGSATISVEITLTDENEPPGRPAAPTVMASSNTLSVRWAEPGNTGPVISDYDVQYREAGGSFTDWSHIGPGLSTIITGLKPETRYEVQVRATNDEGTSGWSPLGNDTTIRPPPGFAPVDQNTFNTFVTDKVLSVETYYIEFVSTGRFKENNQYPGSYTYSNTGSNTGILTQNYDGGQLGGTCTIEMTFSSTTTGTLRAKCGNDKDYNSPQRWRLSDAPDPNAFNIEVVWIGSEPSAAHQAAFNAAVTRWESIIRDDIPDVFVDVQDGGTIEGLKVFGLVDDLLIYARLANIDGPGETLGSAGPREMRRQSKLPIVARMTFDTSDLGDFTPEALQDLYLHEMGHCLGIGTVWKRLGLLRNPSITTLFGIIPVEVDDADTHFAGAEAIEAFNNAGGTDYADGKVPVENEKGGQGTRDGHWRQSVFGPNELMEGFASPSAATRQPLSAITIQSLYDLGYSVDVNQADAYTLPSPAAAKLAIASEHLIPINCILIEPIGEIDEYKPIELKPRRLKIREDQ